MARPGRFDWLFRPQIADEDMPLSAEARFAEALADLPAVERSALALSEIGGLDTFEIAERLGTDPVVVRKLLARARESVQTSIAVRSRRGLSALIPFQNWWHSGSSAPVVRAAGAVAAAVVGTGVAIGGASADLPREVLKSPDPPVLRTLETSLSRREAPSKAQGVAGAAVKKSEAEIKAKPRAKRDERPTNRAAAWGTAGASAQSAPAASNPSATHVVGDEPDLGSSPAPEPGPRTRPDRPVPAAPAQSEVGVPAPSRPVPVHVPVEAPVAVPVPVPVPVPAVPVPAPLPVPAPVPAPLPPVVVPPVAPPPVEPPPVPPVRTPTLPVEPPRP